VVDIKARVDEFRRCSYQWEHIALLSSPCVVLPDKFVEQTGRRRELQLLFDVLCQATFVCSLFEIGHEAFIETHDEVPMSGIRRKSHVHLQVGVANGGGVHVHAYQIVVRRVSGTYELSDNTSAQYAT
jgi:hypothetical protein